VDILRDVVDVAVVGRGENIINQILDGQTEVPGYGIGTPTMILNPR